MASISDHATLRLGARRDHASLLEDHPPTHRAAWTPSTGPAAKSTGGVPPAGRVSRLLDPGLLRMRLASTEYAGLAVINMHRHNNRRWVSSALNCCTFQLRRLEYATLCNNVCTREVVSCHGIE